MARSSSFSLQSGNGIDQCERLLRIIAIGTGEMDSERNTMAIADQVALAPQLASVSGIRSCLAPPKTARTEQLSTTARDQSI